MSMREVNVPQTGKFRRTVHLAFDISVGREDALADVTLKPNGPEDELWVVGFVDRADGETHHYVLNTEFRDALVGALTRPRVETVEVEIDAGGPNGSGKHVILPE